MSKKPIRSVAKEFAQNKKIKPTDYTTEAYEKNDAKNRYNDIICIDATRVVLKDRPPADDYINASWMTMPDGQKYICTQACFHLASVSGQVGLSHMVTITRT
ncbi:Tyrosine-protein phosphatase domain-containing protein, partial [Trichostrongylus colubriformis]